MEATWFVLLLVHVCCFHYAESGAGNPWTYNGTLGPDHWFKDYPHCGGAKQSPINLDTRNAEYNPDLTLINLAELAETEGVTMTLQNVNGHTVEVLLSGNVTMRVYGGGLDDYRVKQFHFHWGLKDERGSEHDIDNARFPMEMHVVMYAAKYDNYTFALDKTEGLAVLAFLFKVGDHNINFDPLLAHFQKITHSGNETSIPTFPLRSLLPVNTSSYFRYSGSLTTPPCYETVVWTVFKHHIIVSEDQLNKFRHLKRNRVDAGEEDLVDDFRPLQKLNNRKIYTTGSIPSGQNRPEHAMNFLYILLLVWCH